MRKVHLLLVLCLACLFSLPADEGKEVKAVLDWEDIKSVKLGFTSSSTISSLWSTPTALPSPTLTHDETDQNNPKGTSAGASIYAYWQVFAKENCAVILSLQGPMENAAGQTINWRVYLDSDRSRYVDSADPEKNRLVLIEDASWKGSGGYDTAGLYIETESVASKAPGTYDGYIVLTWEGNG